MVKTYQGYIQDGQVIAPVVNEVPDFTEVTIIVTGKFVPPVKVADDFTTPIDCPLLGMFADGKISVNKFMVQKQLEKELEL